MSMNVKTIAALLALFWLIAGGDETAALNEINDGLQVRLTDDTAYVKNTTGIADSETVQVELQLKFGYNGASLPGNQITAIHGDILYDGSSFALESIVPEHFSGSLEYRDYTGENFCAFCLSCDPGETCDYPPVPTEFTTYVTLVFKATCQSGGASTRLALSKSLNDLVVHVDNYAWRPNPECPDCWDDGSVTVINPGDLNFDCKRNLADITDMIGSVYLGKILDPMAGLAADVTCDGRCTLDDITRLIDYVYLNGTAPGCP